MKKLILSTLLMAGAASAADQAMIVFDASGSMWGRVDGKEKITIAKDALKQVVGQWNPKTQLGLMAYGHRTKGDCSDIEVLVPIGGFDKQVLLSQVKGISPKGKTPISRSLKQAANSLRYTEDKATVILISDGKETCDADPCATAKELEEQGIDFVTHVIGFNVDKATDAQLSCVAEATGGKYFSAKNAKALNDAMKTVVHTVQKVKPKPQPKPKPKPASKYNLRVKAFETEGGKEVNGFHRIYRPIDEDNSKLVDQCYSGVEKKCKLRIPVGEYFVISEYNQFKVKTPIAVTAGKYTDLNVIMGQTGKVKIKAFETEGGKEVNGFHRIYRPIDEDNSKLVDQCYSGVEKKCKLRIPVGEYFVTSEYNQFKVKTPITVTAGKYTDLNIVMGQTGKVKITASETEGGKQVKASHEIRRPIDKDNSKFIDRCYSLVDEACKVRIPVGEYFLVSTYNEFEVKTPFTITAGKYTDLNIVMGQTGKVKITASETEGGKQVKASHEIRRPIDEDNSKFIDRCYSLVDKACKVRIPVGEYFLLSEYNKFEVKTPFTVTAGQTTELAINFEPLHVSAVGMSACAPVTFSVLNADGKTVAKKKAPASVGVDFVLAAGKYRVEADNDNTAKTIAIDTTSSDKAVKIDFGGKAGVQTIAGYWKTKPSQGQAQIQLNGTNVQGTYAEDNGRVFGDYDAASKTFAGYWVEDGADQKCDTEKDGSYYWGRTVWHFDKNLCTFKGSWGYCGKKPSHDWTGSYLKPLKPATIDKQSLIDADKDTSQASPKPNNDSQTAVVADTGNKAPANTDILPLPLDENDVPNAKNTKNTNKDDELALIGALANAALSNENGKVDESTAKAVAVFGALVQAVDDKGQGSADSDSQKLMNALQAATGNPKAGNATTKAAKGTDSNSDNSAANPYQSALTTSLQNLQIATTCYQQSQQLAQAKSCELFTQQAVTATEKLANDANIAFALPKVQSHNDWNDSVKAQSVADSQQAAAKLQAALACIDQGVAAEALKGCVEQSL